MSTVIPVLGMHRSGTSMITRVLNLLGMQLGEPLLPATPDNPHGYWENDFFVRTNAQVLDSLGQNIHGFGSYEELRATPAKAARLVTEELKRRHIEQTLRGQFNQPVWGWKDPRTVLTYPVWERLLTDFGYGDIRLLVIVREPAATISSLVRRQQHDPDLQQYSAEQLRQAAESTWRAYNEILLDLCHTNDCAIGIYERFLDPERREHEVRRLARYPGLDEALVAEARASIRPPIGGSSGVHPRVAPETAALYWQLVSLADRAPSTTADQVMATAPVIVRIEDNREALTASPQFLTERSTGGRGAATDAQQADAARRRGEWEVAAHHYRAALSSDPRSAAAHAGLGELLVNTNRPAEAARVYESWLGVDPQQPAAANGLGVALQAVGRYDDAAAAFRRSLQLRPDNPAALNNLGTLLRLQNKPHEGLPLLRRALRLDPENATTLTNLAFALLNLGHVSEANELSRRAIAREPTSGNGQMMLGFGLVQQARISEALECFAEANACSPASAPPVANYLFTSLYSDQLGAPEITARHREWAARIPCTGRTRTSWDNSRDPDRRLRVGYLSHDLRSHPVAFFLEPILEHHDPHGVESFCYSTNPSTDDITTRLRSHAHQWRDVSAMDDDRLEALILDDRIDILVDLSGHTSCNRAGLLRRKPAPVQVLYIGYPSTSGMCEIDYLISDAQVSPPEHDPLYVEEVIRLPGSFWCYRPHDFAKVPNGPPASERGFVTFGSFNNSSKLSASTIRLWADVLKAVPGSQLVLKALAFADEATRRLFQQQFEDAGVSCDRLRLDPPTMQIEQFMRSYHEIDIALDPIPYNGGTTTCEALWMGVPVITLPGQRFVSRMTLSFLANLGLGHLAATSAAEYVRLAADLAADIPRRAALRRTLRQTMQRSPICDARRAARELEDAYRQIWTAWRARGDDVTTAPVST